MEVMVDLIRGTKVNKGIGRETIPRETRIGMATKVVSLGKLGLVIVLTLAINDVTYFLRWDSRNIA